jgi:PilZ domain
MPEEDRTERRRLRLDVAAWPLEQTHRLVEGSTVELGGDGALLRLPGIGPTDIHLDVRLALPDRGLFTPATVVRRDPPDLVEVAFDWLDTYERGRLRAFVRSAR